MGWFWQSPVVPKQPTQGSGQQAQAPQPAQPKPQSGSDSDTEVAKFLEEILADMRGTRKPPTDQEAAAAPASSTHLSTQHPTQPPPSTTPQKIISWPSATSSAASSSSSKTTTQPTQTPEPINGTNRTTTTTHQLSPLAESLLPTTMDCTQAFNQAFYCNSLGGQWTAVYRYGGMRSCSEQWNDFWFCMRVKGYTGKVKEDAIRAHYRQKEIDKYGPGMPSSEDIWQERREKVAPGMAFSETAEAASVSDAEFQRAEMERYRRIKAGL